MSSTPAAGGKGAEVEGSFTLTSGEKLEIIVGGAGKAGAGTGEAGGGGGGGGGSFILVNTGAGYVPLLIAGGGGGASSGSDGYAGQATTQGGGAGGTGTLAGGGAGIKGPGQSDAYGDSNAGGGSSIAGNFAGGAGGTGDTSVSRNYSGSRGGAGGFGGGGGGAAGGRGGGYYADGGGGGGYTGGKAGSTTRPGYGGYSIDTGTAIKAISGERSGNGAVVITAVTCFVSGTRIRAVRGDVAVEALCVGDLVVTSSGEQRPIRWIGHRPIDCRSHPRPHDVKPIRVSANAFGVGRPERDLFLSPGHPVLVGADDDDEGGHLVPIMCLVNGTSIERMPVDEVTYWHVELDAHDILLAEGLPAESYLDWGDRAFFTEAADHALANPDFVVAGLAGRCRPVAVDGLVVEMERRRLDVVFAMRLASACAWPIAEDNRV